MEDFLFALSSLIVVIGPWKAGIVFAERTTALPVSTRRLVAFAAVIIALVLIVSRGLSNSGVIEIIGRSVVDSARKLSAHIGIMSAVAASLSAVSVPTFMST